MSGVEQVRRWFAALGRKPLPYQEQTWAAYLAGRSGLIHAPTGTGKTLAAWMGPVIEILSLPPSQASPGQGGIRTLWLTPLRALAADITRALQEPVQALGIRATAEFRTGDVSSAVRARQRKRLPTALVTTPESLSLLLSYPEAQEQFSTLRCVVVDEWHELLSSKRGVQVELALARLRGWRPDLRVWGLSATLGNLQEAAEVLVGPGGELIPGPEQKPLQIVTLIPDQIERFPWAGHLGARLQEAVIAQIREGQSTLLFTNTRSQAELWFEALLRKHPEFVGKVALHHGSLDTNLRRKAETLLATGQLSAVVCTSSLDLGVDFAPVDQVMQLGSPKGVARLMQRAGRSGHRPGGESSLICVPTHAFELIEFAAARQAIAEKRIEPRRPLRLPMDVLVQHLVTVAAGGGFTREKMLEELRTTHAFATLTGEQFSWALDFVTRGGAALVAYPHYRKVVEVEGRYLIADNRLARLHRVNIGTIASDAAMRVAFLSGRGLGTIEESFIARLAPGDQFLFAGRRLQLIRVRHLVAYVREVKTRTGVVPRWAGSRFPLSTLLADDVLKLLAEAGCGRYESPEMQAVRPLLELQKSWSRLPEPGVLLVERTTSREGHHLYLFPFSGRLAHEGLGALLAYRLTRRETTSVLVTANDYGIELLSPHRLVERPEELTPLLSTEHLVNHLMACINTTQLARRAFRDIARVSGLIFSSYPREGRSTRQLQASSDLFFDVFQEFDPDNLLLEQARREVLETQLDYRRIAEALQRVQSMQVELRDTEQFTPLAFPLWADRLRAQSVSSEKFDDRVRRMIERLEKAATP